MSVSPAVLSFTWSSSSGPNSEARLCIHRIKKNPVCIPIMFLVLGLLALISVAAIPATDTIVGTMSHALHVVGHHQRRICNVHH